MSASPCDKDATRLEVRRSLDALVWPSLTGCWRRSALLRPGMPDVVIQTKILDAIGSGQLPARAHITTYCVEPRDRFVVSEDALLSPKLFALGEPGGPIPPLVDWLNNKATRRAGRVWGRVELRDIRVDPRCMIALWPDPTSEEERPPPRASSPASVHAPPRKPVAEAALKRHFLAIMDERGPDDPPSEEWLLAELTNRLGTPPGRKRVRNLWKMLAPDWKRPRGNPLITAKKSTD